jgi:PEP-CTERM/exosortase A-associated glycosyltransferase
VLDGYSQRSRSLIDAQKKMGLHPTVLTGSLHNLDDVTATDTNIDSVDYLRTPNVSGFAWRSINHRWPMLREWAIVNLLENQILELCAKRGFDLIHAHSPALCGLAALRAARMKRVPFVYEIRSFWEDGSPQSPTSLRYRLSRYLETRVVRRADAVVAIAQPILKDVAQRAGVCADRLFHVPNGVDSARFTPRPRDAALASQIGCTDIRTIGFLGTFFPWEGVSWLVSAAAALRSRGVQFKMIIVGDGAESDLVRKTITDNEAHSFISYVGRVPQVDVERYYSIMDLLVYPRLSMRLTEFVTPLKPLEAMALGKPILGSGVGGIRELIDSEVTGLLFEPGNIDDFCRQATRLLQDERLRLSLGQAARTKVCREKDWNVVVARYTEVYETAIRKTNSRRSSNA